MNRELLGDLSQLFTLAFALTTMFAMGLGLTVGEIVAPLRNWRFVVATLVVNFIFVPLVAVLLAAVFDLSDDLRIGLVLIASAAGAPMIPKLVQIAKGDAASAVALVTMQIIATVAFLPVLLEILLPEANVAAGSVATSLSLQMLLPLAAGLVVRARYEEEALGYRATVGIVSNVTLVLLVLVSIGQNLSGLLGLIGTGGLLAAALLTSVAAAAGFVVAVPAGVERRVMALGAGQRNLAAAFIVANVDFAHRSDTLVYLATISLVSMLLLFLLAGEFSRRPRGSHLPSEPRAAAAGEEVPHRA
ncbi:MAG TPA: bile acid:sodium symporter [Candidatus Limnocylindrales bacterium]|nr:bile acid:sodium symporter [Candidatus Limnocylindrales bacterium]